MAVNPAVIGGGVLVAAAAIGGGVYASGALSSSSTPGSGTGGSKEPGWHSFFEDSDYAAKSAANQEYHGKYGALYNKYLVGKDGKNDGWWNKTFKKEFKGKQLELKDKFKELLTDGKGGTNLRDICIDAYKAKKDGEGALIKESLSAESTTEFEEGNIWKFCSPLGKKPIAIKDDAGYTNDKIGGGSEKTKLASAKGDENDKFWEIKQKNFFAGTDPGNEGLFFKVTYDTKNNPSPLSLKGRCNEAYGKTGTGNSSNEEPSKAEVLKYCSLEETVTAGSSGPGG